ncbi:MAG: hypothetical protein R3224_10670, partial [Balneolaceae bacterium]|nr:hypothetical protein [Balneolaceae bacterium]
VIASETPNAITLVNQGGHKVTVARSEIESLEDSGMSAMPPGMEKQITRSEMADLLAYLKGRLQ